MISIAGTFPSHVIGPNTKTPPPGDPSTYSLNATMELRGALVVYGTGDGRFETTLNGASAKSTAPARCNDKPTNATRQTLTRAWIAAGMLYLVRNDETKFSKGGACGGATETLDETLGFKLESGACSFGYTGVQKRNGKVVRWTTIVDQHCDIALPGQPPKQTVAQTPAANPAVPEHTQSAPQAFASAGCTALNGTITFNSNGVSVTGNEDGEGFSAGDKITATTTGDVIILLTDETAQWKELAPLSSGFTYVVPATTDHRLGLGASLKNKGENGTASWSCTPSGGVPAAPATLPGPASPVPAPQPTGGESACTVAPAGPAINKCVIVTCPADLPPDARARLNITGSQAAENLKHIDAELGALQNMMDATKAGIKEFQTACRTPNTACSVRGELDDTKSKLNDLYDALQRPPEEDIIASTAAAMLKTYQQPDCMNQIFQETSDRLNIALDLMQTADKLLGGN